MKLLSTITQAEGKLELDETGFSHTTGALEELEADSRGLALDQETDLSLLDGVPGIEVSDGVVTVDERMLTVNPWYHADASRTMRPRLDVARRYGVCPDNAVIKLERAGPVRLPDRPRLPQRAAACAPPNARAERSRWNRRRS